MRKISGANGTISTFAGIGKERTDNTLGDDLFAQAWAEGRAMSPEQAIKYALEETDPAGG